MAQTFSHLLVHVVYGTKRREPFLVQEIRNEVFAYMGGIVHELGGAPLAIGGMTDHVHLLVEIPPALSVVELLRVVKTNSSRWVHEKWPNRKRFSWQTGYAAFSVSQSNASGVIRYIRNQKSHHQKVSFRDEYLAFLKKHEIPYDERYLFKD